MKYQHLYTVILAVVFLSLSGCYLEQGKIYFDEIGLDPITVYKMAPLERTVYCLAESGESVGPAFEGMMERTLAEIESNPEEADWSELVCLTLADEATPKDLKRTMNTLALILAVQPRKNHPARGFRKIMEQRLDFHERFRVQSAQRSRDREQAAEVQTVLAEEIGRLKKENGSLKETVNILEGQVRKLKEVELLLHPKQ